MTSPSRNLLSNNAFSTLFIGGSVLVLLMLGVLQSGHVEPSAKTFFPVHMHTAMETFSVVVCAMIFAVGWSTFDSERPRYITVLACALLSVGLIDTAHFLSYPGMPQFVTASASQKSIFFWLVARMVIAAALLYTAFSRWLPFRRPQNRYALLAASLLVVAVTYWIGLYHLDRTPLFYVDEKGLTSTKILLEFLLAGAYAFAGFVFARRYAREPQQWLRDLVLCCLTMTIAELYFTLFRVPWDILILLGHSYKVAAYFFLYRAVFVRNVRFPMEQLAASEAALRHSQSALRRTQIAVDHSPDCIFMFDRNNRFVYVNARAIERFGYSEQEFLAMGAEDIAEIFTEEARTAFWRGLSAGSVMRVETRCHTRDNQWFPVEASTVLINEDGQQLGCTVLRDISERLQAEQQVRTSLLNEERARVEAQTKSIFLAQMSHEIRTPMNGILGMSELLLGSGLNQTQSDYCRIIHSSATSLLTVINDILDISKIEAGRLHVEAVPFNVRETVGDVVALMQVRAAEKNLPLTTTIDERVPSWVIGDPTRLRQILLNYLANAIKFTERGSVRLNIAMNAPNRFRFEVIDTGPGIAPAVSERLFNPFTQADSSIARVHGGTGLGLAISKRLAQLMGGDVGVASDLGRGSCFWVELPLSATTPPAASNEQPALADRSLVLLVAEDNPVNRVVIEALLNKLGHRAIMAEGGQQAIELFQQHHAEIDAVLMDCEMPGLSGFEATRRIRALEAKQNWPRCPVLAVSAHALEEFVQQGRDAGMDGHISKPLTLTQLRSSLDTAVWAVKENISVALN